MKVRDIPSAAFVQDPKLRELLESMREAMQTGLPEVVGIGAPLDKFVRRSELVASGLGFSIDRFTGVAGGGSTVVIPGAPGGGGSTTPDLTPPPTPTGLNVTAGLSFLIITCDAQVYTQGHGHDRTLVYGAKWPSGSAPTFADAVPLMEFTGTIGAYPTELGTRWCIWIKWQSVDGVASVTPGGGTNGAQATTGKVGSSDLGDAIVLANNLAPGSVTADKALLEIGGDNLVANNSFEVDADANGLADGWAGYGTQQSPVYTRTAGRISGFAQRVAWSGTNSSTKGVTTDNAGGGGVRGGWRTGAGYVISFYARADTAKATGCALGWTNAPATAITLKNPNLATTWQRYAFRIVTGGAVDANGALRLSCTINAAIAGWIEFDDVQVEEGDTLSGYGGKLALNTIVAGDGAIANLAIQNAQIGLLAVDDARIASISAAKLTVGDGTVGGDLKSSNFVSGTTGWRIRPNGTTEFSGIVARGTIYASAGSIGGIVMDASSIYSSNFVAATAGFKLNSNGSIDASNVALRGAINGGAFTGYAWPAAGGTGFHLSQNGLLLGNLNDGRYFQVNAQGNVNAPGLSINNGVATFGGTLTAQAINAVDTINIAGNALGIMVGASAQGITGVTVTIVITANDIPPGKSSVPVVVTGSYHCSTQRFFDIGRNKVGAFNTSGNLFTALPPSEGVWSATVVDSVPVGTHTYSMYTRGPANPGADGASLNMTITAVLGKRF